MRKNHPCKLITIDYLIFFVNDLGIVFVDDKIDRDSSRVTFRVESTGAASCIDHFAVSHSLYDKILHVSIEDSGINLSDHCPVILKVQMPVPHTPTTRSKVATHDEGQQLYFRWDKADIWQYYMVTGDKLSAVQAPTHLLTSVVSPDDAHASINRFYVDIVECLWYSSVLCVPQRKQNF